MRINARLHHPVVHVGDTVPTHLVVEVEGEEGERLRPPLGLVLLLDRSGSMGGTKHATVTAAIDHLVGYLSEDDVVGLVGFDDAVTVALDPRPVRFLHDGDGVLARALSDLRPRGSTDLDAGLQTALALANGIVRDHPGHVVRVVLLTDGRANVGVTDPATIAGRLASVSGAVSVSTIGVGVDCDHDLLGRLAREGRGSYGFVESPALAAEVLGTEIGGLVNLDAANVVVTLSPKEAYAAVGAPLAVEHADQVEGSWRVRLGHLVAGQTRRLVFPVTPVPPARAHARPVTVADVAVSALVEGAVVTLTAKPKTHFSAAATLRDEAVDEAVDLAILAEAVRQAESAAQRQDYNAVRQVFSQAESITHTVGVSALNRELAASYVNNDAYNSSGPDRAAFATVLSSNADSIGTSARVAATLARTTTVGTATSALARAVGLETANAVSRGLASTDDYRSAPNGLTSMTGGAVFQTGAPALSEAVNLTSGLAVGGSGVGATVSVAPDGSASGPRPDDETGEVA